MAIVDKQIPQEHIGHFTELVKHAIIARAQEKAKTIGYKKIKIRSGRRKQIEGGGLRIEVILLASSNIKDKLW